MTLDVGSQDGKQHGVVVRLPEPEETALLRMASMEVTLLSTERENPRTGDLTLLSLTGNARIQ